MGWGGGEGGECQGGSDPGMSQAQLGFSWHPAPCPGPPVPVLNVEN